VAVSAPPVAAVEPPRSAHGDAADARSGARRTKIAELKPRAPASVRERCEIAFDISGDGYRAEISDDWKRRLFGEHWEREARALQDRAAGWIDTASVQAFGVGYKSCGGEPTDELAIVAYVDRKQPRAKLRDPVPAYVRIPGLRRFPTDVVAIGRLQSHIFTKRVRPAMPGCSIGHRDLQGVGTLGLLVTKQGARGSGVFILSNSHVIALDGLACVGDDVVQPAPFDAGGVGGTIAKLHEWVPFDFTKRYWPNLVDAAIARVVRASSNVKRSIRDINIVPAAASFRIAAGMRVRKVGRTTGCTEGHVINADVRLTARHMKTSSASGPVRFRRQVLCTQFGMGGDSGSIVVNDRNEVVGLYAGGTERGCWFNRIEHVFDLLNIEIAK
jgi:hypothetical protein